MGFLLNVIVIIAGVATVIGAIYAVRTFNWMRRGGAMEKRDPPSRRPIWTWVTIASLVGLTWAAAAVSYFGATRPNLQGEIRDVIGGSLQGNADSTIVALSVDLVNTGSVQSVAREWAITATTDGVSYPGSILPLPKYLAFASRNSATKNEAEYKSEDDVVEQALDPITVGDMAGGLLYVQFPYINTRGAVEFTVTYQDVFSDTYTASYTVPGEGLQFIAKLAEDVGPPVPSAGTNSAPSPAPKK